MENFAEKVKVWKSHPSFLTVFWILHCSSRHTEAATQRCTLRKGILKICIKFTEEHPCRSAISIKLQSNFIEITLRHGCSPVNLLHIFKTTFARNTSGWLLLDIDLTVSSRDILKIIQVSQVDGVRSSVHWHSIHTMENELSYSVKSSDFVKNKYFEILKTVFS